MLLDRRKIRRWAKWVALILAIIFALGFLVGGIGYGTGGFSLLDVISGAGCSETTVVDSTQQELDEYLATLETDPTNTDAMLGAATKYEALYDRDPATGQTFLIAASTFLQKAIDTDPTLRDVYIRLAELYTNKLGYLDTAVSVLTKGIEVFPSDAELYLKLGTTERSLGNVGSAVLAWQKYLQLAPDGEYADVIRQELEDLAAQNTTTTTGPSTTTAPEGTTTSTPTTGTTVSPATTTTG